MGLLPVGLDTQWRPTYGFGHTDLGPLLASRSYS
jgi:hypothetical protein